jgi:hypothetical protein
MKILITIVVAAGLAVLAPASAEANPSCGDAVFRDWSDGRIENRYAIPCYGAALDDLPEDIRAYSTAEDDISQALRARIRETRRDAVGSDGDGMSVNPLVPIALVLPAGIALLLGVAGLVRLVARRFRNWRVSHNPIGQW